MDTPASRLVTSDVTMSTVARDEVGDNSVHQN